MKELTHLSLFTGIGGLDLVAELAGMKTAGQCEWADYPTRVLEKHWPDVPRWKDIRTLTKESFYEWTGLHTVDVISGGFPCQPFSVAGKQRGKEDDRYLWPEMVRVIKELRLAWVVGENVTGIVKMALPEILSELEACGYRTRTFLIPACAVGARHRRYRVAIVAYAKSNHEGRLSFGTEPAHTGLTCGGKDVQHTDIAGRKKQYTSEIADKQGISGRGRDAGDVCDTTGTGLQDGTSLPVAGQGESEQEPERPARKPTESLLGGVANGLSGWVDGDIDFFINHYWDTEPDIPRVAAGVKDRVGRLQALGNAVVPQQFYPVFRAIVNLNRV